MYYLFTVSCHTPIIIYTKDKQGKNAKEALIRAQKKIDYVSEELSFYTFSPYLHQLDHLMGDESPPVFYNKNDKMPKQPEYEHYRLGLILQKI